MYARSDNFIGQPEKLYLQALGEQKALHQAGSYAIWKLAKLVTGNPVKVSLP